MHKALRQVIPAFKVNMDGHYLDQTLPSDELEQVDPFLLLHHWKGHAPRGGHSRDHGVGPHPHRGFIPVTIVFEGGVFHQDSRGNKGKVYEGGVQWMKAGMGIIHSERPPQEMLDRGGNQEFVQLWINLPAANKMDQPEYYNLTKEEVPRYLTEGLEVSVICGQFNGISAVIPSDHPMQVYRIDLQQGTAVRIPSNSVENVAIYVVDGGLELGTGERHFTKDMLVFGQDGDHVELRATADSRLLYLAAPPIGEKVVRHGPYVMNSETEIMQTMRDYGMGRFGLLVEEFDPVRPS